jgi:hypothetical protein
MAMNYSVKKHIFKPDSALGYYIKKEQANFPDIFTSLELLFALKDILAKYDCSNLMKDYSIKWNKDLAFIFCQEITKQTEIKALLESHILTVPANVNQLSQIRIIKKPTVPAMTNEEASTSSKKYKKTKK